MKESGWTFFSTVWMTVVWALSVAVAFMDWGKATIGAVYLIGLMNGVACVFFTWLCLVKWREK